MQALQQRIASPLQTSTESATNTTPRAPIAKLSAKLCSLVHYTQSVRFRGFEHANATSTAAYMSSFSEKKMGKIIHKSSDKLSAFTERHLARVYPSYHRFKSANYDPQVHWNYGCQFVALNWQTPCDEMWLNRHFFARNGARAWTRREGKSEWEKAEEGGREGETACACVCETHAGECSWLQTCTCPPLFRALHSATCSPSSRDPSALF